jgi:hypothetical protein
MTSTAQELPAQIVKVLKLIALASESRKLRDDTTQEAKLSAILGTNESVAVGFLVSQEDVTVTSPVYNDKKRSNQKWLYTSDSARRTAS